MRILFYTLIIFVLGINSAAFANHKEGHADITSEDLKKKAPSPDNADHKITVEINGLVCDFCARALEKVFGARKEVSGIDVNLNTKIVTIGFNKGSDIDDGTITKLITDAGYNVVKINR